jgi:hypothetical protein
MKNKILLNISLSLTLALTACSSAPSTPESEACAELRITQKLISKEINIDFEDRINSGRSGGISEDLLDQHLSAYIGFSKYISKVNNADLIEKLAALSKYASLPKDEAQVYVYWQAYKILEWCKFQKL